MRASHSWFPHLPGRCSNNAGALAKTSFFM
jgi:hypothetical protein